MTIPPPLTTRVRIHTGNPRCFREGETGTVVDVWTSERDSTRQHVWVQFADGLRGCFEASELEALL